MTEYSLITDETNSTPDVFISYSRKDCSFVEKLEEALKVRDKVSWVDWEGIPPVSEFPEEIKSGIEGSDAFLFVISPDSVKSNWCLKELEHAEANNKRLIPVLRREVAEAARPEALKNLQWILLRESDDFDKGINDLIEALDTDLEYLHTHKRLLVRALEWEKDERSSNLTLRGEELEKAEAFLTKGFEAEQRPTALQVEYITISRQVQRRTQRRRIIGVSIALAITAVLAIVALLLSYSLQTSNQNVRARLYQNQSKLNADMDPPLAIALELEGIETANDPSIQKEIIDDMSGILQKGRITKLGSDIQQIDLVLDNTFLFVDDLNSSDNSPDKLVSAKTGEVISLTHGVDWRSYSSPGFFKLSDKYFLVDYTNNPGELRSLETGEQYQTLSGEVDRVFELPGTSLFIVDYLNHPDELRFLNNENGPQSLPGEVEKIWIIPGAPFFVVDYENETGELHSLESGKRAQSLRGIVKQIYTLPDAAFFGVNYVDRPAELISVKKGILLDMLAGPVISIESVNWTPFVKLRFMNIIPVDELRRKDGILVERLPGTANLLTAKDVSFFVIDYENKSLLDELRSLPDADPVEKLENEAVDLYLPPSGQIFAITYENGTREDRSLNTANKVPDDLILGSSSSTRRIIASHSDPDIPFIAVDYQICHKEPIIQEEAMPNCRPFTGCSAPTIRKWVVGYKDVCPGYQSYLYDPTLMNNWYLEDMVEALQPIQDANFFAVRYRSNVEEMELRNFESPGIGSTWVDRSLKNIYPLVQDSKLLVFDYGDVRELRLSAKPGEIVGTPRGLCNDEIIFDPEVPWVLGKMLDQTGLSCQSTLINIENGTLVTGTATAELAINSISDEYFQIRYASSLTELRDIEEGKLAEGKKLVKKLEPSELALNVNQTGKAEIESDSLRIDLDFGSDQYEWLQEVGLLAVWYRDSTAYLVDPEMARLTNYKVSEGELNKWAETICDYLKKTSWDWSQLVEYLEGQPRKACQGKEGSSVFWDFVSRLKLE